MPVTRLDEVKAAALRSVPFSYAPVGAVGGMAPPGFHALERSTVLSRRDFEDAARELFGGQLHSWAGLHVEVFDEQRRPEKNGSSSSGMPMAASPSRSRHTPGPRRSCRVSRDHRDGSPSP